MKYSLYKLVGVVEQTTNYLVVNNNEWKYDFHTKEKEYYVLNEWNIRIIVDKFSKTENWFHIIRDYEVRDYDMRFHEELIFEFNTVEELENHFIEYLI